MASPTEIEGAIALKFGSDVVATDDFVFRAKAFFELLEEITNRLNGEALPDAWSVIVQKGSQILNATPHNLSRIEASRITQAMMNGFELLEEEAKQPFGLPRKHLIKRES